MILKARGENAPGAQEAMEDLARTYWPPLYRFIRREGYNQHQAEDLTQGFYHHFLERRLLDRVTERRGKFRTYLLTCLKHYLSDQRDRERALKRGGGRTFVALDAFATEERDHVEPANRETAEQIYERRWATALLERVEKRLREECGGEGAALCDVLLSLPEADGPESSHAAIASRFGCTVSAVKARAHRLRQRHWEILREEIGRTVCRREDIDAEIRDLFRILGG